MSRSFHWRPEQPPPPAEGHIPLSLAYIIASRYSYFDQDPEILQKEVLSESWIPWLEGVAAATSDETAEGALDLIEGLRKHKSVRIEVTR